MKQTIEYSLQELPLVIKKLKNLLNDCSILTLTGSLGAGKTTLVKELLKEYGVSDRVTSPTFTYINQYEGSNGKRFYHFDLYRIKTLQDFVGAGFQEYLYQPNSMAIIEWPEAILPLLTQKACHANIDYQDDLGKRVLTVKRER
jgi:tRNA threonylcarbamoyladenosine biosynthesis protein TsaE